MNRRGFLKSLVSVSVAGAFPSYVKALSLSQYNYWKVRVTGARTISSFEDNHSGAWRILKFDNAATQLLQYGAVNVKLP